MQEFSPRRKVKPCKLKAVPCNWPTLTHLAPAVRVCVWQTLIIAGRQSMTTLCRSEEERWSAVALPKAMKHGEGSSSTF
jgi:hypothetical protein